MVASRCACLVRFLGLHHPTFPLVAHSAACCCRLWPACLPGCLRAVPGLRLRACVQRGEKGWAPRMEGGRTRGAKHARRATRARRSGTAACCGPCLACLPALLLVCLCGPACRLSAQIRRSAPARACWVFHSRTRRKRTGDAARARLNGLGFPLAVREHPRLNEGVGLRPVPGDVRWTARQEDTQTKCHSRILRVCGVSVLGCPGA